jgi:hypothetical protein
VTFFIGEFLNSTFDWISLKLKLRDNIFLSYLPFLINHMGKELCSCSLCDMIQGLKKHKYGPITIRPLGFQMKGSAWFTLFGWMIKHRSHVIALSS